MGTAQASASVRWWAVLLCLAVVTQSIGATDWAAAFARDNPMRWLSSLARLPAQVCRRLHLCHIDGSFYPLQLKLCKSSPRLCSL